MTRDLGSVNVQAREREETVESTTQRIRISLGICADIAQMTLSKNGNSIL